MLSFMRTDVLSISWLLSSAFLHSARAITLPSSYDTVWTTQSNNSAGSMPVGGGDMGLNVWAENGELLFYAAKSGAFDENNSMLKLGRVRITMDPNPFSLSSTPFEQHLYINDAVVTLTGANDTLVKIWVDIFTSAVHVDVTSGLELNLTASFETWRTNGYNLSSPQQQQTSWGVNSPSRLPVPFQYPDVTQVIQNGVLNYHHNTKQPLFDFQVASQKLSSSAGSLYNPMQNNTFGSFLFSPQLVPGPVNTGKYLDTNFTAFGLVSTQLSSEFHIYLATALNQTTDVAAWQSELLNSADAIPQASQQPSLDWWHAYWDRSYILLNLNASSTDPGFQVGKNYQYFRYMMACNAFSAWPTRFNGGIFTFDPSLVSSGGPWTPDYRRWSGGTFTAQNQRLLYWPLLKSGDFDLMTAQFDWYRRITPNNRILGQTYFDLDVTLFSEQIDNTGLPNVYEYDANYWDNGTPRPALYPEGIDWNNWLAWTLDTANEFADMILQANIYSGYDVSPYLDFIEYQLAFFDEYYTQRNGLDNGTLVIYPGAGAETYKLALNPASTVSGLRKVIADLLEVNPEYVKGNTSYYQQYFDRVPATPIRVCPGNPGLTCIAPASNYSYIQNDEPIALYPVFPWGEYGLRTNTNLSYAINAFLHDTETASWHGDNGWRQDQIWLARMGLTSQATTITESRFADSTTFRFPTFKGPNFDWAPDMNHYGSAAIGLQEQLMQTFVGDEINLLPAWPETWTGEFKLCAPKGTVVMGMVTGNTTVEGLVVTPEERLKDVVINSGN